MLAKLRTRRPSHPAIVAYLALFLALGGGALAATGAFTGSDGKIHGCVAANGALTVLKPPATTCAAGKARIAWNQTGSRGIPGPRGVQGPGAISIPIRTVAEGTYGDITTIRGITIWYQCENGVVLAIKPVVAGQTIYVTGEKASNDQLSAVNASGLDYPVSGSTKVSLDVIATVDGTWNRIDLGGYHDPSGGCNIWGLLIPGT